jgi:hypothetical protein
VCRQFTFRAAFYGRLEREIAHLIHAHTNAARTGMLRQRDQGLGHRGIGRPADKGDAGELGAHEAKR